MTSRDGQGSLGVRPGLGTKQEQESPWASENKITTAYGINSDATYIMAGVHSHHPGGANFTFADGHVSFLSETIDQETLEWLTTRAGGEVIDGSY